MSVIATCSGCADQHPLGDRPATTATTACPACGATSYATDTVPHGETVKPDADRIADAVANIQGVGEQTQRNIAQHFDDWSAFLSADLNVLTTIPGVGRGNGQRIIDARPDGRGGLWRFTEDGGEVDR